MQNKFSDKQITIFELMLVAVLAVGLGVAFWGWTFVYEFTKPFLKAFGLKYITSGFWVLSAILPAMIVRKPGVALFSSVVASLVEGMITNWGFMAGLWGLVQGMGAELIFAIFLYSRWQWPIILLASAMGALCSYTLDYFYYGYSSLSMEINLLQVSSFVFSSMVFAGILSIIIARKLLKTGLLSGFKIAR
ncbi:MAG: ECF transporter S component [Oligoflexia bacterium]|nr:ECF transporter S component [Oligoflexia bacterium]MBF0365793.1 ECF transporter S component [Oligoflexia bacterium]